MTTVSPTQLAVVRWLAAHPDIDISYNPPHGYVMWSVWWRSTPRLTRPTFLALWKRGLLRRTKVLVFDRRVVGQVFRLSTTGVEVARLPVEAGKAAALGLDVARMALEEGV